MKVRPCCALTLMGSEMQLTPWQVLQERWLSVQQTPAHEHPLSPCMSICTMNDSTGECVGCLRTLDEIGCWSFASPQVQHRIWARLGERISHNDTKPQGLP